MDNIKERISGLPPEKLALLIKKLKKNESDSDARIIQKRSNSNEYPMSSEQKGIWFLQQLKPDSTFYNIPAAIKLKGKLNIQALRHALQTIILRHEVLRANFTLKNDEPRQIVGAFNEFTVEVSALDNSDASELRKRIDEIISAERNRKFNLAEDYLIRAKILVIDQNEHLLLLTFHHIISDGWSISIFIKELSTLYQSYAENKEPGLEELPIQYSDYAVWQEGYLQSPNYLKALSYWKEKLSDMPFELGIPLDKKRPSAQSFEGSHYSFCVSPEEVSRIRKSSRSFKQSEFVFYLTAFEILLSRYSNQGEFGIGIPVANRAKLQTQESIGLFTNTVVIRADLTGSPTITDVLQRTKDSVMDAFEYQECPFEKVVNAIQPEHNANLSPLFQIMFDYKNRPLYSLEMAGMDIELIEFERGTSKYDLTLSIEEGEKDYKCIFEYSTDLFLEGTIKRMAENFLKTIEEMLENEKKYIRDIQLITEKELKQILYEWNNTENPYPKEETFHHMFELQAEKTPDRIAVVFEDIKLTFRELNIRANRLAHILVSKGIGPERLVCLYMGRSVDIMVGIFAILKAGGAYLPLDINSPAERLKMILEDIKDPIILTQSSLKGKLEFEGIDIQCIDELLLDSRGFNESNPLTGSCPQNLAYIIYTSGSTGRPKGAMITHQSVVNLVQALEKNIYARALDIRSERKIVLGGKSAEKSGGRPLKLMMNSSLIFDASIQQMILITKGHSIYILPDDVRRDGHAFMSYIRKHRIEVLDCVPSQLTMLLESGLLEENKYCPFLVLPGGEAISDHVWRELSKSNKTEFFNMYGPTETTVEVTAAHINNSEGRPVIGRPLDNVRLYILDKNYRPQPIGVTGELFIAGDCLGRGYLNRPEITAEKFVPNPFAKVPGERIYRTGDLARYTHCGDVEYMGRCDCQVKIRGFRIELGEIESAINSLPGIKESLVIVREESINDKKIVAYLVPKNQDDWSLQDIKQMLRGKLPEYMIPSYLIKLEKFPLMPSGKIDKKMLPAPQPDDTGFTNDYIPPATVLECELVQMCENVLNIKRIGLKDNFFELGGDSIRAAIFINRIQSKYKEYIPVKAVFENPAILDLSRYLLKTYPGKFLKDGSSSPASIKKASREGRIPLSYTQERIWFLEQLEPGKPIYNLPIMFRIEGKLDADLLEESLNEIIRRHEVLRLAFINKGGRAQVKAAPQLKIKCNLMDLSSLPKENQDDIIRKISEETAGQAIPIDHAPLFRICLLALSENIHLIIAAFHHIIMDEWSSRLILTELSEIYDSLKSGREPSLPELKIQYADYAAWQREYLSGENLGRQLEYWKGKLSGIPSVLELPFDHPRPRIQTFRGDYISRELASGLVKSIREFNRHYGVTLFMTMLTAFEALLNRMSGQDDIVIGTPVANRNHQEIEPLIGFFVNTLVIRSRIRKGMTFLELLKDTMESSLEAYTYQDLPFEMLVEALEPERTLSYSPIFQVMFALQNMPISDYELTPGLRIIPNEIKLGTSEFDLTMFISEKSDDKLSMAFEYNTDLFEKETIERLFGHYERIIESMVRNPGHRISEIPVLSPEEEKDIAEDLIKRNTGSGKSIEKDSFRTNKISNALLSKQSTEEVIRKWNSRSEKKDARASGVKLFHRLFEEQAERTPESVVVVSGKESLTYKELNLRANKLANYLMKKGVSQDEVIGVLLGREADLITSILAILKSGGGYLPLDPVYPKGRIEYILKDAGVKLLVSEEALVKELQELGCEVICIDREHSEISKEKEENPEIVIWPENIAYVIYTSGSTGKPKGSIVQHESLYNYYRIISETYFPYFSFGRPVKAALNTTIMFDASIQQLMFLLYAAGGTLYLPEEEVRRDGIALTEYLINNRIDVLDCVPTLLKVFISSGLFNRNSWKPSLVIAGGEALDEVVWKELSGIEGCDFYNTYGPTECTVDAAICRIKEYPEAPTIGKPPLNVEIYILDSELNLVSIGTPGELCIGGVSVGRGYLKKADMTAERFIPDAYSGKTGRRLYRTGDLARYRIDGTVEFIGRIDQQVKLRGFRIELGEIEQVFLQHEKVKEAVVVVKERNNSRFLSAYITLRETLDENRSPGAGKSETKAEDFRQLLKTQLPEYMIPSSIVILEKMPLTPNGKIDRKALPDAVIENTDKEDLAPKTENEKLLSEVWKEILGLDTIGIHDNFFEIGGDSILAIQVVAKANQKGLKIVTKQIFQYPTIYQLSRTAVKNAVIKRGINAGKNFPLTPIQNWFFEQEFAEQNHWNQSVLLEVKEKLDFKELNKAFNFLIKHHDAFRLRFKLSGNKSPAWVQYYTGQTVEPEIQAIDLTKVETGQIPLSIQEISSKLQSGLNIKSGPLIRVAYFDLGENRTARILIAIHHLIIDGVSWRILLRDIEILLNQIRADLELKLPEKTTSYQEWSIRLAEYARDPKIQMDLDYWIGLRKKQPLELPTDFQGNENLEGHTEAITTVYDRTRTQQLLNEINSKYHTKTNEVLLSALLLTFAKWTGKYKILLDIEGHGREEISEDMDVSGTVGWFTNIYPVYLESDDICDTGKTICSVKEQLRNIPNGGFSYQLLRKSIEQKISTEPGTIASPQIIFNYLGQFDQLKSNSTVFEIAAEDKGIERGLKNKRSHLLEISAMIVNGCLNVQWNYSIKFYRKETIKALSGDYLSWVTKIIDNCLSKESSTYTPSDFQDVKLRQDELRDIISEINGSDDE